MIKGKKHRQLFTFLFIAFLVFGCGSVFDQVKMNKFAETHKSYSEALLWGHFEAANLYRKPELAREEKPDFGKLKNIKVTQYDVTQLNISEDGLRVDQEAEIAYFQKDRMIVKTVRDQQVWKFDHGDQRWYLTTRLPEFP